MLVEINDLDSIGQVNDVKPHLLPPEAFTVLNNIRLDSHGLLVSLGWEETMVPSGGSRMWDPHFAIPVKTPSQTYWLYTSLEKAAVFDGTDDFDVTNVGGDYSANESNQWNGCILGGVPIINNGTDTPQFWSDVGNTSQKLTDLTNWPANMTAGIIRSYGPFLIAFNIVDGGTSYPHLVQWSHPADPGSIPSSWDYTDPTLDAGRNDLPDTQSGEILEAMQLQDTMYIYKQSSIWKMKFVGGRFIMDFGSGPWLEGVGILGARCVTTLGDGRRHCVATQDDIIVHNGNSVQSILLGRQKTSLFNTLNREMAYKSFMFTKIDKEEVWFCYPETGQEEPNKALIWKYSKGVGAISFIDGITFRNAVKGDIEGQSDETWDEGDDEWDEDTGPWSEIFREQIVLCDPTSSMLYQLDKGNLKNTTPFAPTIIRESLGVLGRNRKGEWITDVRQQKMVDAIWPKAEGAPFRIRVGFQNNLNDAITWQPYTTFNPTTDKYVNPFKDETLTGCGIAFSIEFSAVNATPWHLDGYKIDVIPVGVFE